MKMPLNDALSRQAKLAFRRVRPGGELIKRFHALPDRARTDTSLQRLCGWLVVPYSLWPIDVLGLASHVVTLVENGKMPSAEVRALISLLGEPPNVDTCDVICAYEHLVSGGSYECLIKAQHKFNAREKRLLENQEFLADWKWIRRRFDISKHQGDNGVIRRRMIFERNFRPPDWDFSWKTAEAKFENVFDAFCHKWTLYGMERDKPLLQKLSVTITPYGTMVVIPRFWSFDHIRDLEWREIMRLHNARKVPRQGAKLAANQAERRLLAKAARNCLAEAKRRGMKGEAKDYWVMEKAGLPPNTDPRQLRRLVHFK
ncbi:MAG: hypothetical protein ABSA69_11045 [Verrucomicrobiota bacterium]|jgi:hypothetical protein